MTLGIAIAWVFTSESSLTKKRSDDIMVRDAKEEP